MLKRNKSTADLTQVLGRNQGASQSSWNLLSPFRRDETELPPTRHSASPAASQTSPTVPALMPNSKASTSVGLIPRPTSPRSPRPSPRRISPLHRHIPVRASQREMIHIFQAVLNNDTNRLLSATTGSEGETGILAEIMLEALFPSLHLTHMASTVTLDSVNVTPIYLPGYQTATAHYTRSLGKTESPFATEADHTRERGISATRDVSSGDEKIWQPGIEHGQQQIAASTSKQSALPQDDVREPRQREHTGGTITLRNHRAETPHSTHRSSGAGGGSLAYDTTHPPETQDPVSPSPRFRPLGVIDQALDAFANRRFEETPHSDDFATVASPLPVPTIDAIESWIPPDGWKVLYFKSANDSLSGVLKRSVEASIPVWFVCPDGGNLQTPQGASFFFVDKHETGAQIDSGHPRRAPIIAPFQRTESQYSATLQPSPNGIGAAFGSPLAFREGMSQLTQRAMRLQQAVRQHTFDRHGQTFFFHPGAMEMMLVGQLVRPARSALGLTLGSAHTQAPGFVLSTFTPPDIQTITRIGVTPPRVLPLNTAAQTGRNAAMTETVDAVSEEDVPFGQDSPDLETWARNMHQRLDVVAALFPPPPVAPGRSVRSPPTIPLPRPPGSSQLLQELDDYIAQLRSPEAIEQEFESRPLWPTVFVRSQDTSETDSFLRLIDNLMDGVDNHNNPALIDADVGEDDSDSSGSGGTVISPPRVELPLSITQPSPTFGSELLGSPATPFGPGAEISGDPLSPLDTTSIHRGVTPRTHRGSRVWFGLDVLANPPVSQIPSTPAPTHIRRDFTPLPEVGSSDAQVSGLSNMSKERPENE